MHFIGCDIPQLLALCATAILTSKCVLAAPTDPDVEVNADVHLGGRGRGHRGDHQRGPEGDLDRDLGHGPGDFDGHRRGRRHSGSWRGDSILSISLSLSLLSDLDGGVLSDHSLLGLRRRDLPQESGSTARDMSVRRQPRDSRSTSAPRSASPRGSRPRLVARDDRGRHLGHGLDINADLSLSILGRHRRPWRDTDRRYPPGNEAYDTQSGYEATTSYPPGNGAYDAQAGYRRLLRRDASNQTARVAADSNHRDPNGFDSHDPRWFDWRRDHDHGHDEFHHSSPSRAGSHH